MRCINEISRGFKGLPSCLDTLRCVKFTLLIRGAFRLRPMESCKRINEGFNNMAFEGAGGQLGEFALHTRRMNSLAGVTGNAGIAGDSPGTRCCAMVFTSLALISLMIAVILPFAGLEAFALYVTFVWITRHARDSESLVIRGNAVALAVCEASQTRHYEFNRAWAQLVVEQSGWHGSITRLALRSHGREVEVGRYLDDGGRQRLARELQARLRGG
jgi:uncharacterized membrane protein